jgi:phage terminase large subunit-like protein
MALNFLEPLIDPPPSLRPSSPRAKNRSGAIINYIQELTVPSGVGAGKPFRLREWQKQFIRDVYDPVDPGTGNRIVRRAILSMARKNGKTALIAALVLAHLEGPEAIANGELYSAANDHEQAGIVFRFCHQMVECNQRLCEMLKVKTFGKEIRNKFNGTLYKAITAESGTKHGLNPNLVIYDELAQSKSRDLYDVLDTSMGAREEPLFIAISTQSNDPEHIFSRLIDDGLQANDPSIVCHLYEVPLEEPDVFDPACWKKANPALGDFRSLEDLKSIAAKAKRLPAEEPKFRNLYLNQRVSAESSLISRADWMACQGGADFEDGEPVWLALDMSAKVDLTALIMGSAGDDTRIAAYIWKPQDFLLEHSDRDFGSGNARYVDWFKQGHLLATPGRSIDPELIAMKIGELWKRYKVQGLVYDRWGMGELLRALDGIGLAAFEHNEKNKGSGLRLYPWGQGYKDMGPAVEAFEVAVINRKLKHPNNPVLTWSIANAVATTSPGGYRKLDKDKARFRIDPAVALAMLMGIKARANKPTPTFQMFFA